MDGSPSPNAPGGESSPPSASFGRELRLRQAGEFRHVREKGRSRAGRYMIMNVARPPENPSATPSPGEHAPTQFGFITSRKVGKAVQRNQVRRRLKEITRLHRAQVRPGLWVVLVARHSANSANYQLLQQEWLRLAGQLGILTGHPRSPGPRPEVS